jgi:hypothetical protein
LLSRTECLKILELGPVADQYEIENRYTMLIKRYRGHEDAESINQLEQISMAYNILTGRYIEPEPEDPRLETVILGKSRRQWRNIWHYGRTSMILGLLGVILAGYFVYTIVTNKAPDFQIVFAGYYSMIPEANIKVESYVKSIFPAFDKVEYQALQMDLRDSPGSAASGESSQTSAAYDQNLYAYIMKMMTMMVGDSIEVYVCDLPVFNRYAPEGAFTDLTALYNRLQAELPAAVMAGIKPLRRVLSDASSDQTYIGQTAAPTQSTEDIANADTSLPIYGLDVTKLRLTEGLGIYGENEILTIGIRASAPDQAAVFLRTWISDYQKMNEMQKANESAATN